MINIFGKTLILIFFIISSSLFSQSNDATIVFKDGTEIEGLAEITKKNEIKFRLTEEDEPGLWTSLMVHQIIFNGFEYSLKFEYIQLEEDEPEKLLEVLIEGDISLYSELKIVVTTAGSHENNGFRHYYGKTISTKRKTKFYTKKVGEFPVRIRPFAKDLKEYFSDCIGIIENLDNRKFGTYDFEEMVEYYNNYCVD